MVETGSSSETATAAAELAESIAIMARLRGPGGCPWDREQTFDSIKRHTLEETYEVFDAIERRAWPDLRDELGDLLLQVLFYAQMAAEAGYFNIAEVAAGLNAKLIRRHPHIFGNAVAEDANTVLHNWEAIKRLEKQGTPQSDSMLADIPRSMPALNEAHKLGARTAKVGFDWPGVEGVFEKVTEEVTELREALRTPQHAANSRQSVATPAVEDEVGDLLFTVVHLARHLHVDPETALRGANAKFRRRFRAMEAAAGGPDAIAALQPSQREDLWIQAKRSDSANPSAHRAAAPASPLNPNTDTFLQR